MTLDLPTWDEIKRLRVPKKYKIAISQVEEPYFIREVDGIFYGKEPGLYEWRIYKGRRLLEMNYTRGSKKLARFEAKEALYDIIRRGKK